ncbi:MAG TPA: winged helix-turn-helix transcriptional regulator [Anaerolineaceae bacterium]|jgi:DNA-binding MarR family transcriptional regulator|nr:winged helix-turn-helix domain-containing protein [Anaerolineales bacterium]HOG58542.1 winged helix-turn-helix transcriptional regulator [Anaerolineaceae bacterium]HOR83979.1 winged helix-turn-helix transcriptional regulator [Anaerolineaceae bacterium]HPL42315.1 winged helix-turn-helix transcriptional regulator [Anaerolineaceae bacterium]HPY33198.1 winged helix-turn-helix transcriptional regulator [Anaerolineaceae bacterium]
MEAELSAEENSRALDLLTQIEANPDISQASLAGELGVAVGTINWYLKRLISKGYVKVKRAQRKKLRYIITPEGIALRASLTVDYIRTSFDLYRRVRERSIKCIEELTQSGHTTVRILGDGEVAEVIRLTCIERGVGLTDLEGAPEIHIQGIKLALIFPDAGANHPPAQPTAYRGNYGPGN